MDGSQDSETRMDSPCQERSGAAEPSNLPSQATHSFVLSMYYTNKFCIFAMYIIYFCHDIATSYLDGGFEEGTLKSEKICEL